MGDKYGNKLKPFLKSSLENLLRCKKGRYGQVILTYHESTGLEIGLANL